MNKKILFISIIALLFSAILLLLIKNSTLQGQLTDQKDKNNSLLANQQEKIKLKDLKLDLCYQDRALVGDEIQEEYAFDKLGIYSQLFADKKVTVTPYEYKGNIITKQSITSGQYIDIDLPEWRVDVWTLEKDLNLNTDFPVFDYSEGSYNHPHWLSKIKINWDINRAYTNPQNIKMYLQYHSFNKDTVIYHVSYDFYLPNLSNGKSAYITIKAPIPPGTASSNKNNPIVIETIKKLQQVVDTIDYEYPSSASSTAS